MITFSPDSARISAVTPPPAPLPITTTSASNWRSAARCAPSTTRQPRARPASIGSGITLVLLMPPSSRQLRDRARVTDRRPVRRLAVPAAQHQVVQRLVGGAQQAETVRAPVLQEVRHLVRRGAGPVVRDPC